MNGTSNRTFVRLAAFAKAMLAIAKLAAASASGSAALLADAVHSIAGAIGLALLLLGTISSAAPSHPPARREAIFWGFVVGTMVMSLAAGVAIVLGVQRLQMPEPLKIDSLPFFVLAAAATLELGLLFAVAQDRRSRHLPIPRAADDDPAVRTLWLFGLSATASLLVVAAALSASSLDAPPEIDGWSAILVGLVIGSTAALLALDIRAILRLALIAPPQEPRPQQAVWPPAAPPATDVTQHPSVAAIPAPTVKALVETPSASIATLDAERPGAVEMVASTGPGVAQQKRNDPPPKHSKGKKKKR